MMRPIFQWHLAAAALAGIVALWPLAAAGGAAISGPSAASTPVRPDVRNSPGYVPLRDTDSMDVRLGRRHNAPLVDMEFRGGPRTLREMGRALCHALHTEKPDSVLALCVKSDEFRVILWPEFPQSRPAEGLHWDDAWVILFGRLNGGSVSSVREYGEHTWKFIKLEFGEVKEYRNFRMYRHVRIHARNEKGQRAQFTFVRSIVERKGRLRIYSMKD